MLFSLYPLITQHYFILSFLVCAGTLQWSAARHQRVGLSLLGPTALNRGGQLAGLGLVVGGFTWFFAQTPNLFQPGLAGGELSTLFGAGGASALLVTRLGGLFWQKKLTQRSAKPMLRPETQENFYRDSLL